MDSRVHNDYEQLISQKDEIEAKISELMALLEDNNRVGLREALVDTEGYPRSDIDVYSVRHARHNIACLQNDHKEVMKKIELKLYEIHEQARNASVGSAGHSAKPGGDNLVAFLLVNQVSDGSPADQAGIRVGDCIKQFGSVTLSNFKSLQDIGLVVQHSKDKIVRVVVSRESSDYRLELTPRTWAGRGLLGCNVVEIKPDQPPAAK